jgi:hypothetical protein
MVSREDDLWIATFGDVTRYIRGRMNSVINAEKKGRNITVNLTNNLDATKYYIPLTLKTYIPSNWKSVTVKQGKNEYTIEQEKDNDGYYVLYQAMPDAGEIILNRLSKN